MFRRRATELENAIESAVPSASIERNREKARTGTFEVAVNGDVVLSLVAMPRPFKKLRSLDMDGVVESVIARLGGGAKSTDKKVPAKKKKAPAKKKTPKKTVKKSSTKRKSAPKRKAAAPSTGAAPKRARRVTRSSASRR